MSNILRKMLVQGGYMDEADDGTKGGGGGSGSDAEKAAADKAAADKADAEKAAAEDAKKKKGQTSEKEAELLREVMEKKKALKEATDSAAKLADQLKRFEGIDPDKVRELLKQQQDAEEKKLEAQGEWDKLKKQMAEAHKVELAKSNETVTTLQTQVGSLQSTIAELTVGNAFGVSKFIAEEMAIPPSKARIVYGTHFEFKDGQVVGFDKPAGAANRTMLVDASGDPLSFEDAIRKIVDADTDKEQLLKSKLKPGAGSTTQPSVKGAKPQTGEKTSREKIAAGLLKLGSGAK